MRLQQRLGPQTSAEVKDRPVEQRFTKVKTSGACKTNQSLPHASPIHFNAFKVQATGNHPIFLGLWETYQKWSWYEIPSLLFLKRLRDRIACKPFLASKGMESFHLKVVVGEVDVKKLLITPGSNYKALGGRSKTYHEWLRHVATWYRWHVFSTSC